MEAPRPQFACDSPPHSSPRKGGGPVLHGRAGRAVCAEERRGRRPPSPRLDTHKTHTHLYVSLRVHKRQTRRLGSAVSTPRRLVFGTPRGSPRPFHRQLLPLALLRTPHCALAPVLFVGVCCSWGGGGWGGCSLPWLGFGFCPALGLEKPEVCVPKEDSGDCRGCSAGPRAALERSRDLYGQARLLLGGHLVDGVYMK